MSKVLEDYRIHIMNQIIGFNPTGQLKLKKNGTIQFMGNISQIYTPQTLQATELNSTSNNELINNQKPISVIETFTNNGNQNIDIKKMFYILLVVILFLIIYMNIKKI